MPKMYSSREVLSALFRCSFVVISQRGSHIKMRGVRNGFIRTVIVPNHKEIATGTFLSILKQADLTKQEFENLL